MSITATTEQLRKKCNDNGIDEEAYIIFSTVLIFMTARAWDVFIKTVLVHYRYNTIPYEFLFALLMTIFTYFVIKTVMKRTNISLDTKETKLDLN